MKNRVIIVECFSSAVNYIYDLRQAGLEPVLLELFTSEDKREEERRVNDSVYSFNGDVIPDVICLPKEYNEILKIVKRINPMLILPGSDPGLNLSMRLSSDLNLKSNPVSAYMKFRDKFDMQEALRKSGIRYIPTTVLHSEEEAAICYRKITEKKVVLKPSMGSATHYVYICSGEDNVRNAYRAIETYVSKCKRPGEKILMQEYIDGEEYVLDTISCNGYHAALFGMRYLKRFRKDRGAIYDTDFYISPDEDSMDKIAEYLFRVLDCLGVKYGPVHSEIKVDSHGPVLVEINCRPAGAFQKYSFQDKVMQVHETKAALDSYLLDPKDFSQRYPRRMSLKQPAVVKQICIDRDIYVKRSKLAECFSKLKSYDYVIENGNERIYPMTVDLDTTGGMIYLTDPDPEVVKKDLEYINAMEKDHLDSLYDYETLI